MPTIAVSVLFFGSSPVSAETIEFTSTINGHNVLGLDLEFLGDLTGDQAVVVDVTCQSHEETPALKLVEAKKENPAKLVNYTSAPEGCGSYLIEVTTSFEGSELSIEQVGVGIAVDGIASRLADISVFVFNPVHGNWSKGETYRPNQAKPSKAYATLTERSQQIIAGHIAVPSLPTPGPLSTSDLSDALEPVNPIAGLLSVAQIEPNSKGQAVVELPLLLRPTRGPVPRFSIVNSPEVGIGVLGKGWDLKVPRISVRGPSPIYHSDLETEDYFLDGRELIALDGNGNDLPPLYKGGPLLPRVKDVRQFRTRDASDGSIIRRFGSTPNSYYWEVWNPREQATQLFGASLVPQATLPNPQIVINDWTILRGQAKFDSGSQQQIGVWGLSQEFENQPALSGTTYSYQTDINCTGYTSNCVRALRPRSITYNQAFGSDLSPAAQVGVTTVDFKWVDRSDPVRHISDGRLGFLRANENWLSAIHVSYNRPAGDVWFVGADQPVVPAAAMENVPYSVHEFVLSDGKNGCLNFDRFLQTVIVKGNSQYDKTYASDDPGSSMETQTFHFKYDGEEDCAQNTSITWPKHTLTDTGDNATPNSGISFPSRLLDGLGLGILTKPSLLGESRSDETAASMFIGIGPIGDTSIKPVAGGISAGLNFSRSRSGSTLVDVTGDGIDDVVYRTSSGLRYCRALREGFQVKYADGDNCGIVYGLHDIGISSSQMQSFGVEGFVYSAFFGIGYNSSENKNYVYFTHRDADGLIDAVVYGKVLYGQGEICTGGPGIGCNVWFSEKSALTPPLPAFERHIGAALTPEQTLENELFDELQARKPPGFRKTIDQMGKALEAMSQRLRELSFSQTTIAWEASLTGKVKLEGTFALDDASPDGTNLSAGLRRFPLIQAKANALQTFYNDCNNFPNLPPANNRPHCDDPAADRTSFAFVDIPASRIRLDVARSRKTAGDQTYKDSVKTCGSAILQRGSTFALNRIFEADPNRCPQIVDAEGNISVVAGDVVYLTYSVHPDHTASLAPDARYKYTAVKNDAGFDLQLKNGDYDIEEVLPCRWRQENVEDESCLLGQQTRYSFPLATGMMPSNARASMPVPPGTDRAFGGKFEISTRLTQEYQVYFDVFGTLEGDDATDAGSLPLLLRFDVSESCSSVAAERCQVNVPDEPVSALPCSPAGSSCPRPVLDDLDAWRLTTRLSVEHLGAPRSLVRNLDARLTSLEWFTPPNLKSKFIEQTTTPEPAPVREGETISGDGSVSRLIRLHLPFAMGDLDLENRRVEHGTFKAPNPQLNETSEIPIDVTLSKIIADEALNVELARTRQHLRLCGFADEIRDLLKDLYSASTVPFADARYELWNERYLKSSGTCADAALSVKSMSFTGGDAPEFDEQERLKLRQLLRLLSFDDQLSSSELLIDRVLKNLELPLEMLTDDHRLSRRGYRLPVKANPLDCELISASDSPLIEPLTGRESTCSYRVLMNFAMEDIRRLFPDTGGQNTPDPHRLAYEAYMADFLTGKTPAFEIELMATVNGVPVLFSELTGEKASNQGRSVSPASLKHTCIGQYGAHETNNQLHFHPYHKDRPNAKGDIFQRIVTNRRAGRAVAFSDDVMHTDVPGKGSRTTNGGLGLFSDVYEMEAKQDCDNSSGMVGANAKFVGEPNRIVKIDILENNRVDGRGRVFEFEARPLDIVEFHVRLKPVQRELESVSDTGVPFKLYGKFSALEVKQIAGPNPVLSPGQYLIPRSPSQIVPPNHDAVDCGSDMPPGTALLATCRPWLRLAWAELLLGAEYRTYSDGHKTIDNKHSSLKRRRDLLRVFPEIEIDSTEFNLHIAKKPAALASKLYRAPASSYTLEVQNKATRLRAEAEAAQFAAEEAIDPDDFTATFFQYILDIPSANVLAESQVRIAYSDVHEPNILKNGSDWLFWAQKAVDKTALSDAPLYGELRYKSDKTGSPWPNPKDRYQQAETACLPGGTPKFGDCKNDTESDGQEVLSFSGTELFPLEHRFVGPAHDKAKVVTIAETIAKTDICANALPHEFASCWQGQDDTIYLVQELPRYPDLENGNGEYQSNPLARSVAALVGHELPLLERYFFELDAFARVACNDEVAPSTVCDTLELSPGLSDADVAIIQSGVDIDASHYVRSASAAQPGQDVFAAMSTGTSGQLVRAPPSAPNRPTPPIPTSALHVFAPVQASTSQSVSRNLGAAVAGISFNKSTVFNESTTSTLFIDINGDGYPEVLDGGSASLTSPVGLLRSDWWRYFKAPQNAAVLQHGLTNSGFAQKTESKSEGAGFGITPTSFAKLYNSTIDATVSPSFDLSFEHGKQEKFNDYRDFNGDGIVDNLMGTAIGAGIRVKYSVGNALLTEQAISDGSNDFQVAGRPYNTSHGAGFGIRLGFNIHSGSILGGMGLGARVSGSEGILTDFTGDGRVDIVVPVQIDGEGNGLVVFPNLGNGFAHARLHKLDGWGGSETTVSETTLVDGGTKFSFGVNVIVVKLSFNVGVKKARNHTRELLHLRDMNGDGVPDLARVTGMFKKAEPNSSGVLVPEISLPDRVETNINYNPDATYHLLAEVTSPTKVKQSISYTLQGNTGPELGVPVWAVETVSVHDGFDADATAALYPDGQDVKLTTYVYGDGFYNRAERAFYGFADIQRDIYGGDGKPSVSDYIPLQRILTHLHNRDYLTKGRMVAEVVLGPPETKSSWTVPGGVGGRPVLSIASARKFEFASAARRAYSIDNLSALIPPEPLCDPSVGGCDARWAHGDFASGSEMPPAWQSASSTNIQTNSGSVFLNDNSICSPEVSECSATLLRQTDLRGFAAEQAHFWAQQTGTVRERISDLHISEPGHEITVNKAIDIVFDTPLAGPPSDKTLFSSQAVDHDQWGQPTRVYVLGETQMDGHALSSASFFADTLYEGRNGLPVDLRRENVSTGRLAYPILGLASSEMFNPWPGETPTLLRMREAIYQSPQFSDLGTPANLTDVCTYPPRDGLEGFRFRPGLCAGFKEEFSSALSDGLSTLKDALRAAYKIDGLPTGTNRFDAIVHTRITQYDDFGNIKELISPFNDNTEWIERRFDYGSDPFVSTPSDIALTRCVQDSIGVGVSAGRTNADIGDACGLGHEYQSDNDKRKAVTHGMVQRVDPHHGTVAGGRDPNGNAILVDLDRWGRVRLLARNWGTAPRHNKTFARHLNLAARKNPLDVEVEEWRLLALANYSKPEEADTSVFASHIRRFASSDAYSGDSGRFGTVRHNTVFSDGQGKVVQSVTEAEVCAEVGRQLLYKQNFELTDELELRCGKLQAGRIMVGSPVDALGRPLARLEGYASDADIPSGTTFQFLELTGPLSFADPLSTLSYDSGSRLQQEQTRIADAPVEGNPAGIRATQQYHYSVVQNRTSEQIGPRFRATVMTPRCSVSSTYLDPRGLTSAVMEVQDALFVEDKAQTHPDTGDGEYSRQYGLSLGFCSNLHGSVTAPGGGEEPLVDVAEGQGVFVAYTFDPLLQLSRVDFPLNDTERSAIDAHYDRLGRLTEMRDPDSGCTRYQFDNLNNLIEQRGFAYSDTGCDPKSKPSDIRRYNYAADRLTQMTYASLDKGGTEEDRRDAVTFFHDRYPHATLSGELLEPPKLLPNTQANRRFFDKTGKDCENCIGQISMISDRTGARSLSYTELGQTSQETRSIVAPVTEAIVSGGQSEAFMPEVAFYTLRNAYTSFGDLSRQDFVEAVPSNPSKMCDIAGPETCVAQFSLGHHYAPDGGVARALFNDKTLVSKAHDALNRPATQRSSDGTVTGHYYDRWDLRLNQTATLTAAELPGLQSVPVQITGYQYDGGGNVLRYRNMQDQDIGYHSRFTFDYDGANRLTNFTGFASLGVENMSAEGSYGYDEGHRFNTRSLRISGDPGARFERNWTYDYSNTAGLGFPVHAPRSTRFDVTFSETTRSRNSNFIYDDVGRLAKVNSGDDSANAGLMSNRALNWDAAGRLKSVRGGPDEYWPAAQSQLQEEYIYDYAGNRTLKIHRPLDADGNPQERTTIYMTPFYSRPAEGRGSVQISLGPVPVASLTPPTNENAEPYVSYLYKDLAVGTVAASVLATGEVTDPDSTLIARREFSPFGLELTNAKLARPNGANHPIPSVFHGKELDSNTGFSSFGARYFSRDMGLWLSPDPLGYSYLFGSPSGGVFLPKNLSEYAFSHHNPTVVSDPTGSCAEIELDGCKIIGKSSSAGSRKGYISPNSAFEINARAIFGSFSKGDLKSDFGEYQLGDLGGSIQKFAQYSDTSLHKAILRSARTGRPQKVSIDGLIATKNSKQTRNSFFQKYGIGRFSVKLEAIVSASSNFEWAMKAIVQGEIDKQDYPYDKRRSDEASKLTKYGNDLQKRFGGKDYLINPTGWQKIEVRGWLQFPSQPSPK